MLALYPDLVTLSAAIDVKPAKFPPYDVYPVKPEWTPCSGTLSSPQEASVEKGHILLDVCTELGEGVCENLIGDDLTLGGICQQMVDLVPLIADLDIDGDPSGFEALSVGLRAEGVPARVSGLATE